MRLLSVHRGVRKSPTKRLVRWRLKFVTPRCACCTEAIKSSIAPGANFFHNPEKKKAAKKKIATISNPSLENRSLVTIRRLGAATGSCELHASQSPCVGAGLVPARCSGRPRGSPLRSSGGRSPAPQLRKFQTTTSRPQSVQLSSGAPCPPCSGRAGRSDSLF